MSSVPQCWLMKSEPQVFSFDALRERGCEPWEGVRNYQARNFMRDLMRVGDPVLFYHSSCPEPGIAGLARVASRARPDLSALDPRSPYHDPKATLLEPRWFLVDVAWVADFPRLLPLARLRQEPALADLLLLQRGQRLSIQPVASHHYQLLLALAQTPEK